MKLTKIEKIHLFQQMTGWSVDKIRANKKQVNALLDDSGGEVEGAISYNEQELTEEQKTQARENIDAGSNADLSNALGELAVLEEIMGIDLDPDLDEKYYKYFTIEATQDNTTISFVQSSRGSSASMPALKVEASVDGNTWTEVTATSNGATVAQLNSGDKVYIRGTNDAYGFSYYDAPQANCNFSANKDCYVYGNIMSLIYGNNFARQRVIKEYAFSCFFSNWVLSKDGEELILPATNLSAYCYASMFKNCSGITIAPKLPATTLAERCYYGMFEGCSGIISLPELPATKIAPYCYSTMFKGCTSITSAPELPATTLASGCYSSMFQNCTSLVSAPELPAETLQPSCYGGMFNGCTSLILAPKIKAATLATACCTAMFNGCSALESVVLPATILAERCYNTMFYNCTSLTYVKAMFVTEPGSNYTSNWLSNVPAAGTFVKNSAATWNVTGNNGVPDGWTVETANVA